VKHENLMLEYALKKQRKISNNAIRIQNAVLDRYLALQQRMYGDPRRASWIADAEKEE